MLTETVIFFLPHLFPNSRRGQLLKVTSADVKEVAGRYLLDQQSSHCILGDKE